MRATILILMLAAATPALAQPWQALLQAQDAERMSQEEAARRRDIETHNALTRLEAQAEADRALASAPSLRPSTPVFDPKAPPQVVPDYARIPDSVLAASTARALAASANRR